MPTNLPKDVEAQILDILKTQGKPEQTEAQPVQKQSAPVKRQDTNYMHRLVEIPMWLLFLFIGFTAVGIYFTGYQIAHHIDETLIGVGLIIVFVFIGKSFKKSRRSR